MKKKLLIVLGLLTGIFASSLSLAVTSLTYSAPPSSLEDLVNTSDLVVIGKIDEIIGNKAFYGYQESAEGFEELDKETPLSLGIYMTDFSIKVNQVIKGDVKKEKSLILRITTGKFNDLDHEKYKMKKNKVKIKKQVFFLRKNPDDTYGVNTVMGALFFKDVEKENGKHGEEIIFKHGGEDEVPFNLNNEAESFLSEIEYIVDTGRN